MNKKITFAALAALTALAVFSCAKQEALVPEPEVSLPADPWTFVPGEDHFVGYGDLSVNAQYGAETKSQLLMNGAGTAASVTWTAGDQFRMMAISGGSGAIAQYKTSESGGKVSFTGGYSLPYPAPFHCLYPNSSYVGWGNVGGDFVYLANLPSEQTATPGNLMEGTNLSYAQASTQSEDLHFQNFVSIIKFKLSGDIVSSVKKVKLYGTSYMSGVLVLRPNSEGVPEHLEGVNFGYERFSEVSLCGDFVVGQEYYIAAAPGVHDGFIMTFYNEDGTQRIKKVSSKTLTLDRSRIKDFGTINLGTAWDDPSAGPQPYIKHTVTPYATIAVVPDGYTEAELDQYELDAKAGIDALFNTEPYKSYKSHFNVWILKVASNESGARISDGTPEEQNRDCYFESTWGKSTYNEMSANDTKVFSFVSSHCPDIQDGIHNIKDVPVLLIINDNRYGGIAINYDSGQTYCMVPKAYNGASTFWSHPSVEAATLTSTPWDTRTVTETEMAAMHTNTGNWHNTLVHEFGGHSIGKLGDEYWYNSYKSEVDEIYGHTWPVPMSLNVSAKWNAAQTPWAGLFDAGIVAQMTAKSPLYGERIGVFQGADVSMFYRWRSERISCMIDNRFYFSTWQRYIIVNRIMTLAGLPDKTLAEFLVNDVPEDPLRDIIGSPVMSPDGVSYLPPRPVPMLPPPRYVEE